MNMHVESTQYFPNMLLSLMVSFMNEVNKSMFGPLTWHISMANDSFHVC